MVPFALERQLSSGTARIVVRGELDLSTGPRVEEEVRRAEAEQPGTLILDLREVTFFDSTGLQLVLDADVRAREEGRTLIVLPGDGEPRRILELAEVADRLRHGGVAGAGADRRPGLLPPRGAGGRAAPPRLRDRGARHRCPRTPTGSSSSASAATTHSTACRELAGGDAIVILVGDMSPLDGVEAGAADVWELRGGLDTRIRLAHYFARLQTEHVRIGGEFALLRQALDLAGTGFILTDPRLEDHPIVYVNQSFLEITGYTADEVLGRNCRFLQGRDTDPARVDELRRATRERRPATVELRNYRKDGTPFWNEVHISPVRDARGEVVRFVGVQVDVTAHPRGASATSCASRPRAWPRRPPSAAARSWPRRARCWTPRWTCARRWTR